MSISVEEQAFGGETAAEDGRQTIRYTKVAIVLHWTIAGLIILNLAVGWFMEGLGEPYRTLIVRLHQSSGITVLVLTLLRIVWRLMHKPPEFDERLTTLERAAAKTVHFTLYVAMIGIPLSGWALISANPPRYVTVASKEGDAAGSPVRRKRKHIMMWGAVPLIPIKPLEDMAATPGGRQRQYQLHEELVHWHAVAGYALLALLVIHVLGALKHEVVDRRPTLIRMGVAGLQKQKRRGSK